MNTTTTSSCCCNLLVKGRKKTWLALTRQCQKMQCTSPCDGNSKLHSTVTIIIIRIQTGEYDIWVQSDGVHTGLSVDEYLTPAVLAKSLLSREKASQNQPHREKSKHKATELPQVQCYTHVYVTSECHKPIGVEILGKMYKAGSLFVWKASMIVLQYNCRRCKTNQRLHSRGPLDSGKRWCS